MLTDMITCIIYFLYWYVFCSFYREPFVRSIKTCVNWHLHSWASFRHTSLRLKVGFTFFMGRTTAVPQVRAEPKSVILSGDIWFYHARSQSVTEPCLRPMRCLWKLSMDGWAFCTLPEFHFGIAWCKSWCPLPFVNRRQQIYPSTTNVAHYIVAKPNL
jgi:hypothetical protein